MKTWITTVPVAYLEDAPGKKGFIGLQVHAAGEVEQPGKKVYFKNIKIKTQALAPEQMPENMHVVNTGSENKNDY